MSDPANDLEVNHSPAEETGASSGPERIDASWGVVGADGPIILPREVRTRIDEAVRIIDVPMAAGGPADYVLAPLDHAQLYATAAPELAERLAMTDVQISAENYARRDADANRLRADFQRKAERARSAVLVSAVAAALLVASGGAAAIPGLSALLLDAVLIALSVVAVTAGALAAGWIQAIRGSSLLERWMKRRAEAESERLRYFTLLSEHTRLTNPLLQLEYIRRYQLDVQRSYFEARGDDHRRGGDRQIMMIAMATTAAGIATGVAGVLGASLHPSWATLAALALVAQAFASRAENRMATEQSIRNAERYDKTRAALEELYRLLDRVRLATATAMPEDDLRVMREYVAAIHERLAAEHRQWLDDTQQASAAIARLEALLEEAREE